MSATRGVPALDPTLNRVFAELVLVAEADRDVNARPHSNQQVLGYARAARRYATARCWPEVAGALQQLALVDGIGADTAIGTKVRACAEALLGAHRVKRIELAGLERLRLVDTATPYTELTTVPEHDDQKEKTPA